MYKFRPALVYKVSGREILTNDVDNALYTLKISITDDSILCSILPKHKLELVSFRLEAEKEMADDEVFFVNGFQSWSTSLEVSKNDKLTGITNLAKVSGFTRHIAAMSGDALFCDDYKHQGVFHSFTYTYFRRGDEVELFGSLSERTGYTIFRVDAENSRFVIEKDIEGITAKDEEIELFRIKRCTGTYDECFDEYFAAVPSKHTVEHLSGYTSWYNYFQNIDEKIILRDLDGLDKVKDSVSIFQIDDGYEAYVGDWLDVDKKKFPNGMKYIADRIHGKGYLAGIWVAPFSVQRVSKIAKEHPDWLIKNKNGRPEWGCVAWGGAYTIDMYNPGVREYIKHFFDVILREWGFDMVKLDFLYSEALYPRNGKSRGMIMCEALDFLRECVGEDKLILGCGVPLGPSFGVVDACRISCDVDLKYGGEFYSGMGINRELPSAQNAINNTIFRRHLNGRVFCNDPDVFFLRKNNLTFTDEQKELLGTVNNLFGDVLFVSDNAGDYGEKETEMVKKFFAPGKAEIISAYRTTPNVIDIKYRENGEEKKFVFNIKTGEIITR